MVEDVGFCGHISLLVDQSRKWVQIYFYKIEGNNLKQANNHILYLLFD